jgi:hypothetical protein
MNGPTEKANPRDFLRVSVLGAGVLLAGFDKLTAFTGFNRKRSDSFEGGQLLGLLDFVGESPALLNSVRFRLGCTALLRSFGVRTAAARQANSTVLPSKQRFRTPCLREAVVDSGRRTR